MSSSSTYLGDIDVLRPHTMQISVDPRALALDDMDRVLSADWQSDLFQRSPPAWRRGTAVEQLRPLLSQAACLVDSTAKPHNPGRIYHGMRTDVGLCGS